MKSRMTSARCCCVGECDTDEFFDPFEVDLLPGYLLTPLGEIVNGRLRAVAVGLQEHGLDVERCVESEAMQNGDWIEIESQFDCDNVAQQVVNLGAPNKVAVVFQEAGFGRQSATVFWPNVFEPPEANSGRYVSTTGGIGDPFAIGPGSIVVDGQVFSVTIIQRLTKLSATDCRFTHTIDGNLFSTYDVQFATASSIIYAAVTNSSDFYLGPIQFSSGYLKMTKSF